MKRVALALSRMALAIVAVLGSFACARAGDAPAGPVSTPTAYPVAAAPASVPDAAPAPPDVASPSPCSGKHIAIASALFDARCELPDKDLDGVRKTFEAAPKSALETSARRVASGHVVFTIANRTQNDVAIPLMFHSAIDPFPVMATKGRAAAIRLHGAEIAEPVENRRQSPRGQYLAITLEAGGQASVELQIVPKKKLESVKDCPPNAKCAPRVTFAPLEAGAYSLRISGPLVALRDDVSAVVAWTHTPSNGRE